MNHIFKSNRFQLMNAAQKDNNMKQNNKLERLINFNTKLQKIEKIVTLQNERSILEQQLGSTIGLCGLQQNKR